VTTQTLDEEITDVDRSIRVIEDARKRNNSPTHARMLGKLYRRRADLFTRLKAAQEARRCGA